MSDAPAAVACADMCAGCKDECAACAAMACGSCGGCGTAKLALRARAAVAQLELHQIAFGFNRGQRRGPDGRWIDMGGAGSAGGGRGATPRSGRRAGSPSTRNDAATPQHDLVRRLQRIVEFDEEEKGPAPTPSYTAEVAQSLQQALDSGDQAEIARWERRALAIVDDQEKYRGLNEPDLGDGVARGKLGFRTLKMQQRDQIGGKLTREQIQDGLEQYLSNPGGYKAINEVARAVDTPFESMTRSQQERVRQLDRIVSVFNEEATTLQQDAEVWRGVRDPGAFLGDLKPGMEFVDSAPVSTSLDKDWATQFVTAFGGKKQKPESNALLKIRVKTGQKGLVANSITGEFDTKIGWEQEREMLLPPGTRFRVVGKTESTDWEGKKIPTYEVEVVETPVQAPRGRAKRAPSKVEEGRNLKKVSDLPIMERSRAVDMVRAAVRAAGAKSSSDPEIQGQLIEVLKKGLNLNTRSAKLLLKDFNKYRGIEP